MNLQAAFKISSQATTVLDHALGEAQLLLSRKKQERDERVAGFKSIIAIMESELENADAEIEALERIIFGDAPKPETAEAPAEAAPDETEIFRHGMGGTQPLINGHDQEAAE